MSRKKDAFVNLVLKLFLLSKVNGIRHSSLIRGYIGVISSFIYFKFQKNRCSASHGGKICGYLLQYYLLHQFGSVGYCSISLFSVGGELNDYR